MGTGHDVMSGISSERYVSLATFKKDGREVRTPVWIAIDERGKSVIYTNGTSGKVKRIRNNGNVRVAPCDMRGGVTGEWVDAKARLVEDSATRELGLRPFIDKYGWQMRIALLGSRLSGTAKDRALIELDF